MGRLSVAGEAAGGSTVDHLHLLRLLWAFAQLLEKLAHWACALVCTEKRGLRPTHRAVSLPLPALGMPSPPAQPYSCQSLCFNNLPGHSQDRVGIPSALREKMK